MKNGYELTTDVKEKYVPIIKKFIDELEAYQGEPYDICKDFTRTELNPYTLGTILTELGYEEDGFDKNGWEMDFWITYKKSGFKNLMIAGTGITFEMVLRGE